MLGSCWGLAQRPRPARRARVIQSLEATAAVAAAGLLRSGLVVLSGLLAGVQLWMAIASPSASSWGALKMTADAAHALGELDQRPMGTASARTSARRCCGAARPDRGPSRNDRADGAIVLMGVLEAAAARQIGSCHRTVGSSSGSLVSPRDGAGRRRSATSEEHSSVRGRDRTGQGSARGTRARDVKASATEATTRCRGRRSSILACVELAVQLTFIAVSESAGRELLRERSTSPR